MNKRSIFWLWLPLALSFTLMMLEGPTIQAALARLASANLHIAAFGLTLGLSLLIESPVIMLLATAIALVKDAQSYRALRLYMVRLSVGLTLLTALIAFTPLFDWITLWLMGTPKGIAAAARPALQIMLFWTAAIAWRRFYQGILVRYGHTKRVSWGTAIRLTAVIVTSVALVLWSPIPGAQVGAISTMAGVVAEALATTLFAMPVVKREVLTLSDLDQPALTQHAIFRFHAPLAGTVLISLLIQPITQAALSRLEHPTLTLAAWSLVFTTLIVFRGWGFALQEIAVALAKDRQSLPALREFTWWVGGVTSALLALLALTPLNEVYLAGLLSLKPDVQPYVRLGIQICLVLPLITALGFSTRGLLVAAGTTYIVYRGMGLNVIVNAALLTLGVLLQLPGMIVATVAFMIAAVAEYAYLVHRTRLVYEEPLESEVAAIKADGSPSLEKEEV